MSIEGYRGLGKALNLNLALPDGNRDSGLTFLVGTNNSGKSTILETFTALARDDAVVPPSRRNRRVNSRISFSFTTTDGGVYHMNADPAMPYRTVWKDRRPDGPAPYFLPSRRQFASQFPRNKATREGYLTQIPGYGSSRGGTIGTFVYRLLEMAESPTQ